MSYTFPPYNAADDTWQGEAAYTFPTFNAADDTFVPPGSRVQVWISGAWVSKPLKRWNGYAWVATKLKYYNSTTWVLE